MKITLYMAVSSDGFIAKEDGDSGWVSKTDSIIFREKCKEIGCIVLGKRTFEQFRGSLYPFKDITNFVLTRDFSGAGEEENVRFVNFPERL